MDILFRMINHFNELGKKPQQFKTELLYPSEIHLLCFVDQNPDNNITEIAQKLGVTKGAVSQVISKLEKKGVIKKFNLHNQKEVFLCITEYGNQILDEYSRECYLHHCEIEKLLGELNIEQLNVVKNLFTNIDEIINSQLQN